MGNEPFLAALARMGLAAAEASFLPAADRAQAVRALHAWCEPGLPH